MWVLWVHLATQVMLLFYHQFYICLFNRSEVSMWGIYWEMQLSEVSMWGIYSEMQLSFNSWKTKLIWFVDPSVSGQQMQTIEILFISTIIPLTSLLPLLTCTSSVLTWLRSCIWYRTSGIEHRNETFLKDIHVLDINYPKSKIYYMNLIGMSVSGDVRLVIKYGKLSVSTYDHVTRIMRWTRQEPSSNSYL